MTEYGQAFYGSDEIHAKLGRQLGKWQVAGSQIWRSGVVFLKDPNTLYILPVGHLFYDSDVFKRAKKPTCNDNLQVTKPLADYSDDELQDKIKSMQAEIERRKSKDDEITILARQICADNYHINTKQPLFIEGKCDSWSIMRITKVAIAAGMKLQKGREA